MPVNTGSPKKNPQMTIQSLLCSELTNYTPLRTNILFVDIAYIAQITRGYPVLQVMPQLPLQLPLQLVEGGDTGPVRAGFWESMWCLMTPAFMDKNFVCCIIWYPHWIFWELFKSKNTNRLLRSFIRVDATVVQDWKQETTGQDRQDGTTSGYGGWGRMEYGQVWSEYGQYMVTFCWFCDQAMQFSSALGDVLQILHDAGCHGRIPGTSGTANPMADQTQRARAFAPEVLFRGQQCGCSADSSRQAGSLKMHI